MKHLVGVMCLVLAACGSKSSKLKEGNVELKEKQNKVLGENEEVIAISRDVVENRGMSLEDNDLFIGLDDADLKGSYNYGGVIVGVDAPLNPNLNHLKLSALPNFNVKLEKSGTKLNLNIEQSTLLSLDIVGRQNGKAIIDLEAIGKNLNLYHFLTRGQSNYKPVSNQTVRVNYVAPTITFDVLTKMQSMQNPNDKIEVLSRWYLQKDQGVSRSFISRPMTEGVGFFGSASHSEGSVRVFDLYQNNPNVAEIPVVIKNFPDLMKEAAADALEEWNDVFERHLGIRPITYTYVDLDSELQNMIMSGDIRFNVIEWDVYNQASYEGLGPCVGNSATGKTMSCATLIQGPRITERTGRVYKDPTLVARVMGTQINHMNSMKVEKPEKLELSLGKVSFNVPALDPTLRDEHNNALESRFRRPPAHLDSLSYLQSYIQAVVAHEFGHNLGLRHNFKASLYANEQRKSASVMDYLFTFTEYDLHVEEYDDMAIAYGYAGVKPHKTDMYCTDQDAYSLRNPSASVECKRFDFTSEPYKFYKKVLSGLLDDSLTSVRGELKYTQGLLRFAVEGIVGHLVNTYFGMATTAFEASADTKQADMDFIVADLNAYYCTYKKSLQIAEQTDSENAKVFEKVFKSNTVDVLGPIFPQGSFDCSAGVLANYDLAM